MNAIPLLTILVAVPAVAALCLWVIPPLRTLAREFGLAVSILVLAGAIALVCLFDFSAADKIQLMQVYPWIPRLGASWSLGVNGMGLSLIVLATVLVPLVLLAAWRQDDCSDASASTIANRRAGYVGLTLFLEAFMVLIFAARDVLLFYVAFEAMLIPVYFLIGRYGGPKRKRAAMKFLIYSLLGGLIMLPGVIGVFLYGGGKTFAIDKLATALPARVGTTSAGMWLFISFFIAFAIKAPMVPVHTWLPDTAQSARPGTSVILVGVLDKIGTFGMIALCLPLFPQASRKAALVIIVLAVVSVLYGALAAIGQKDIMRLVSFTSISHFGFIVMGIFVFNQVAMTGAMIYMVAHGISIAGMFLVSGFLTQRGATQKISEYGGMQRVTPVLAGVFLLSGLASVALPGLSGFVPEYMVLLGAFKVMPAAAAIAAVGVVLAALYILIPYQAIFTGPKRSDKSKLSDLDWREKAIVTPIIVLMLVLGLFPKPLIDLVQPVANHSVSSVVSSVVSAQEKGGN